MAEVVWQESEHVAILSVAQHADGTLRVTKQYNFDEGQKTVIEIYGAVDNRVALTAVENS